MGQYAVFVVIALQNGQNNDTICSAVSIVNVTAAGGNPATPPSTVQYGPGDTTTGSGSVSPGANGTYTQPAQGYNPTGCSLLPIPMGGGEFPNPAAGQNKPANGNWGPTTVTNLPAGSYLVLGVVTFSNGTTTTNVYSQGAVVPVAAAKGMGPP